MPNQELIDLAKEYFLQGTEQFDISRWIKFDGLIRMDLSTDPPTIHREKDYQIDSAEASKEELELVFKALKNLPKLRPIMYKYKIHAIFTAQERAMMRGVAPDFVEMLLMADDPVETNRIVPYLMQLYQAGMFSEARFYEIVGE